MSVPYLVSSDGNMIGCFDLKEVFDTLKLLQERGLKHAEVIGTNQWVRLTDRGYWVWTNRP